MGVSLVRHVILLLAFGPLIYYGLALAVSAAYFRVHKRSAQSREGCQPPVSILKPVQGLDWEAYENFASFCRQDYPEYEILFCVSEADDPVIPVIQKLQRDFPQRQIRLLVGMPMIGTNRKVSKLCRLARDAKYDLLVASDGDVRVGPNYLRSVATLFSDPQVGAVTTLFRSTAPASPGATVDAVGSAVEFATSALLAQRLEGIRFTLGATMATTKDRLAEIGGFETLADHHADDYELGRRIALRGYRVALAPEPVWLVYPRETVEEFLRHELRWTIGLKNVRPRGHAAMAFTFGLAWTFLAAAVASSATMTVAYVACYLGLRYAVYGVVGAWGLDDPVVKRWWILAPLRDVANFTVWVASFFSNRIQWRGMEFWVRDGLLIPITALPPRFVPRRVSARGHAEGHPVAAPAK